jgi:hypothetical protein
MKAAAESVDLRFRREVSSQYQTLVTALWQLN